MDRRRRLDVPDQDLFWAVGIEDTCITSPQGPDGRVLDEYRLTQHDRFWREDLDRVASLGVTALRYGIPWQRVNPAPGRYDWRWLDAALAYAATVHDLTLIADLVHYGTPPWLAGSFADPGYPAAVAAYAGAFAERYAPLVRHYTPLNEPLVTASFCGERGVWPPSLRGDEGWTRVVLGVVAGVRATVAAIRAADPAAVIVHVEAGVTLSTEDRTLVPAVEEACARAFLPTDLLLGRVDDTHPMAPWLRSSGAADTQLAAFRQDPPAVDLLAVNYYPGLSSRELVRHEGRVVQVAVDAWDCGLVEVLQGFSSRYRVPLLVGETAVDGDDDRRVAWLKDSVGAVTRLRAEGVPVYGYTWWPLVDFVDWSYVSSGEPVEEFLVRERDADGNPRLRPVPALGGTSDDVAAFLRPMGLWSLRADSSGTLERVETPAAMHLRTLAQPARATGGS